MFPVFFIFVCVAAAVAYPTESPISEPPDILVESPDELGQVDGSCESLEESSPFPVKREDEEQQVRRCRNQNFIRLGRAGFELDNPVDTNTNLVRIDRGGKSNENFIRFGRGSKDGNFIRFGREKPDETNSFLRLGRGKSGNFIRLGRQKSDNFIRFGRGRPNNFIRLGRMPDNVEDASSLEVEEDLPSDNSQRVSRGSNFIRLGRAKGSNFIRLGRAKIEDSVKRSRGTNFLRFGRNLYDEDLFRSIRSGSSNGLRRGKLTDRNFIRLGRSGYNSDEDNALRPVRSNDDRNFIRFGKRAEDDSLLRFGRDVEQIDIMPILSESNPSEDENKTEHSRKKRAASYNKNGDMTGESSEYGDGNLEEAKMPFGYYSPLTSGLPNYILGPELAMLVPLSNGAKRAKGRDHSRNYIRLG